MSILSEILATKRTEVEHRREKDCSQALQEKLLDAPPPRNFRAALESAEGVALIAEVKKASPSKGIIREDFDPIAIADAYLANGATCLSVVTDEKYFQGKLDYLTQIRSHISLPLLRKDFIVDPWQIAESRVAGADAILLIVAALPPADLRCFLRTVQDFGMAAIVEVHDRNEMAEALDAGADLIGLNNRDLHTFRTTLAVTLGLLAEFPPAPGRLIISESGIYTHDDVLKLQSAGVDAVLIGEALMREADIGAKMRSLLGTA
jgi:indole-3-glycerol phosphate synthase